MVSILTLWLLSLSKGLCASQAMVSSTQLYRLWVWQVTPPHSRRCSICISQAMATVQAMLNLSSLGDKDGKSEQSTDLCLIQNEGQSKPLDTRPDFHTQQPLNPMHTSSALPWRARPPRPSWSSLNFPGDLCPAYSYSTTVSWGCLQPSPWQGNRTYLFYYCSLFQP